MQITTKCCCFFVFLACMVSYCYNSSRDGNFISQEEECTRGARDKKNEEALKKEEDASQAVQLPLLRFQRFTDVSVILIKFRDR